MTRKDYTEAESAILVWSLAETKGQIARYSNAWIHQAMAVNGYDKVSDGRTLFGRQRQKQILLVLIAIGFYHLLMLLGVKAHDAIHSAAQDSSPCYSGCAGSV